MLTELLREGFGKTESYNCAERILYGANQAYGLKLNKEACKLMAGFGGGMGVEATCGALSGCVAALSCLFVSDVAHESERIRSLTRELFCRFQEKMGSADCATLKKMHRRQDIGCDLVVLAAAEVLDDIICRERNIKTA